MSPRDECGQSYDSGHYNRQLLSADGVQLYPGLQQVCYGQYVQPEAAFRNIAYAPGIRNPNRADPSLVPGELQIQNYGPPGAYDQTNHAGPYHQAYPSAGTSRVSRQNSYPGFARPHQTGPDRQQPSTHVAPRATGWPLVSARGENQETQMRSSPVIPQPQHVQHLPTVVSSNHTIFDDLRSSVYQQRLPTADPSQVYDSTWELRNIDEQARRKPEAGLSQKLQEARSRQMARLTDGVKKAEEAAQVAEEARRVDRARRAEQERKAKEARVREETIRMRAMEAREMRQMEEIRTADEERNYETDKRAEELQRTELGKKVEDSMKSGLDRTAPQSQKAVVGSHLPQQQAEQHLSTTSYSNRRSESIGDRESSELISRLAEREKEATREIQNDNAQKMAVQQSEQLHGAGQNEAEEIRALFQRMRQLNKRNPRLVAEYWEQERAAHMRAEAARVQQPGNTADPQKTANTENAAASTSSATLLNTNPQLLSPLSSSDQRLKNTTKPDAMVSAIQAHPPPPHTRPPSSISRPATLSRLQPSTATTPITSQLSARQMNTPQASSRIWPADKKATLAAAAAGLINSIPENRSGPITIGEIATFLDTNPSYIDLCEMLERRGLKFNRTTFARDLLSVYPDVNGQPTARQPHVAQVPPPRNGMVVDLTAPEKPVQLQSPINNSPALSGSPSITNPPQQQAAAVMLGLDKTAGAQSKFVHQQQLATLPTKPPHASNVRSRYFGQVNHTTPGFGQSSSRPKPVAHATKSSVEPSRLRVVDPNLSKKDQARKRSFGEIVDLTAEASEEDVPPSKKAPPANSQTHVSGSTAQNLVTPVTAPPLANPEITRDDEMRQAHVVEPIDNRRALRKSAYDPRTIARDVLLATGRHPEARALNSHLDVLKTSFRLVDNGSDLSTFRWDLVDPGEPIPLDGSIAQIASHVPNVVSAAVDADADADDEGEEDEINLRLSQPPRQPVRIGTDHDNAVEIGGLDSQVTPAKFLPGKTLAEPISGKRRPSRAISSGHGQTSHAGQQGQASLTSTRSANTRATQATPSTPSVVNSGLRSYSEPRAAATAADNSVSKKGRKSSVGTGSNSTTVERRSRNTPSRPSGLRQVQTATGGVDVVIPSRSPSHKPVSGKKRRRPSKTGEDPDDSPEPIYNVYKCEWKDCIAKLHNLPTLIKHVEKLHGKQNPHRTFDCLWGDCGEKVTVRNKSTGVERQKHQYLDFDNLDEWRKHMMDVHINRIAWKLGDGHVGGFSSGENDSDMTESYLFDSRGRIITPQATLGQSTQQRPGSQRVQHEGRMRTPEENAMHDLEAEERRKKEIGPGIDRGGCRLTNTKRRMGFIDDDSFAGEVEADDE